MSRKYVVLGETGIDLVEDVYSDYKEFKRLLNITSPITVVERQIGNNLYDIWCDDEGLLKEDKKYCKALLRTGDIAECLVGNILIAKYENGRSVGLTEEEIEEVKQNLVKADNLLPGHLDELAINYGQWGNVYIKRGQYILGYTL